MRIALGMIVLNEAYMLSLLLHRYYKAFDGIVAVDTGSSDSSVSILQTYGAQVFSESWSNFGAARNTVLKNAQHLGYDAVFMMDADEAILLEHALYISKLPLGAYAFPRLEFIHDSCHINSKYYPDMQVRIMPLDGRWHYRGEIHEIPFQDNTPGMNLATVIPFCPIFHYGRLKDPKETCLSYHNHIRTKAGLPRLSELPKDAVVPESYSSGPVVEYFGPSPL